MTHFDAVLRHEVVGVGGAEGGGAQLLVRHVAQEQRHADQGVAAVVQVGDDDAAVALTADDGAHFLHHRRSTKLNEAKISIREEGTISADDLEKELGL